MTQTKGITMKNNYKKNILSDDEMMNLEAAISKVNWIMELAARFINEMPIPLSRADLINELATANNRLDEVWRDVKLLK